MTVRSLFAFISIPFFPSLRSIHLLGFVIVGLLSGSQSFGQNDNILSGRPVSGNTTPLSHIDAYRQSAFGLGANRESGPGLNGGIVGGAGGSPLADFNSLMTIIETVVSNGEWESQGGTSAMTPHPNGVRINTQGVIERVNPTESRRFAFPTPKPTADLKSLGDWQEPSPLRWISLMAIDQLVQKRLNESTPASVAMELMGGLYRIDYLAFDADSNDWLIGGPAGNLQKHSEGLIVNSESGLPPVLLEDLLSIAPLILNGTKYFGCTIDPDAKRLLRSYEFAKKPTSLRSLQKSPERFVAQWKRELGNQLTKVEGLPSDSPTGYAMLIADAEMKRLGMGIDALPREILSYWEEFDLRRQKSSAPMVRWWFTLSDDSIPLDQTRKIYSFEKNRVKLNSESQQFDERGQRVGVGETDLAAELFARKLSIHYESLYKDYPIFGRLKHIMDLAVVFEIVRNEISNGNGKPLETLSLAAVQPHMPKAPTEIESIATAHKAFDGSSLAVVSGGVSVYVEKVRERIKPTKEPLAEVSISSGQRDAENDDGKRNERFWR